jgi:hypothetical protein
MAGLPERLKGSAADTLDGTALVAKVTLVVEISRSMIGQCPGRLVYRRWPLPDFPCGQLVAAFQQQIKMIRTGTVGRQSVK